MSMCEAASAVVIVCSLYSDRKSSQFVATQVAAITQQVLRLEESLVGFCSPRVVQGCTGLRVVLIGSS